MPFSDRCSDKNLTHTCFMKIQLHYLPTRGGTLVQTEENKPTTAQSKQKIKFLLKDTCCLDRSSFQFGLNGWYVPVRM